MNPKHLFATVLTLATAAAQASVAFYVNAHADDAELFMGQNLPQDIYHSGTSNKIIVITTTAGDAGAGAGNGSGVAPYYLAREAGHANALQFAWGLSGTTAGSPYTAAKVMLAGKQVYRAQINNSNIVWYNLRLPDGNPSGSGYGSTFNQSLTYLKNNQIPSISAVDGSATYTRAELLALFQAIVRKEAASTPTVWANLVDQSASSNPGDHADHLATSQLFSEAISGTGYACINKAFFSTYVNSGANINMSQNELWIHIGMWGALNVGRNQGGQQNTWEGGHNGWLGKQYITNRYTSGTGCTF